MHIPVFKTELIESLEVTKKGTYVDLTLGSSGHTQQILEQLAGGTLVVFDVDLQAIQQLKQQLSVEAEVIGDQLEQLQLENGTKVILANRNFVKLASTLRELQIDKVNGVIADLGWSTDQLDRVPGLSYRKEEPLDMRFEQGLDVTAADLLAALSERELKALFSDYADIEGQELNILVEEITTQRKEQPIKTTIDLLQIIDQAFSRATHRGSLTKHKFSARVFQALRIAVNLELSTLQSMLLQAWDVLRAEGALAVITFHSGEERVVREQLMSWVTREKAESMFGQQLFIQPSLEELEANLRARSAKLFAIHKLK